MIWEIPISLGGRSYPQAACLTIQSRRASISTGARPSNCSRLGANRVNFLGGRTRPNPAITIGDRKAIQPDRNAIPPVDAGVATVNLRWLQPDHLPKPPQTNTPPDHTNPDPTTQPTPP